MLGAADAIAAARHRLQVLLKCAEREPNDSHYAYYIAKTYHALGDVDGVLAWAGRYSTTEDRKRLLDATVLSWMAAALLVKGDRAGAGAVLAKGLQRFPGFPDLHFLETTMALEKWHGSCAGLDPVCEPSPVVLTTGGGVVWGEDAHQVRHRQAAENFSRLRRFAAGLIKQSVGARMSGKRLRGHCNRNPKTILRVLAGEEVSRAAKRRPNRNQVGRFGQGVRKVNSDKGTNGSQG